MKCLITLSKQMFNYFIRVSFIGFNDDAAFFTSLRELFVARLVRLYI
jgi:hypothetical protein